MTDAPPHARDLTREAYRAARAQMIANATASSGRAAAARVLAGLRRRYPETAAAADAALKDAT